MWKINIKSFAYHFKKKEKKISDNNIILGEEGCIGMIMHDIGRGSKITKKLLTLYTHSP